MRSLVEEQLGHEGIDILETLVQPVEQEIAACRTLVVGRPGPPAKEIASEICNIRRHRVVTRSTHAQPSRPKGRALGRGAGRRRIRRGPPDHLGMPGYAPTPLVALSDLADQLGLAAIHYKDESGRFGLGSFKALGGAYAVARVIMRRAEAAGVALAMDDIVAGQARAITEGITVCCATDGNHGRSVAWGARTFGCRCVIFIHATVSEGRKHAIEAYGAEVRRTAGNYDDSVREAEATARREGWIVVSDTSIRVIPRFRATSCRAMSSWRPKPMRLCPSRRPTSSSRPGSADWRPR